MPAGGLIAFVARCGAILSGHGTFTPPRRDTSLPVTDPSHLPPSQRAAVPAPPPASRLLERHANLTRCRRAYAGFTGHFFWSRRSTFSSRRLAAQAAVRLPAPQGVRGYTDPEHHGRKAVVSTLMPGHRLRRPKTKKPAGMGGLNPYRGDMEETKIILRVFPYPRKRLMAS